MYKQSKLGHMALVMALAVAAVDVATAGNDVSSGGKTVNEVYGRAAGGASIGNGAAVGSGGRMSVSEVSGRDSRMPATSPTRIQALDADVEQFGRNSTIAMIKPKLQSDTLAQTR